MTKFTLPMLLFALVFVISCNYSLRETPVAKPVASESARTDREFEFNYSVEVYPTSEALDIFLPIAQSTAEQKIIDMQIHSAVKGVLGQEARYGNKFWHASLPQGLPDTLKISIDYIVGRGVNSSEYRESRTIAALTDREETLFLMANSHVPVSGALVDSIRQELPPAPPASLDKARSIYDYVVGNMEYKKIGTGWGNGDTYWACSEKYGNCTDFHALFTSLARAEQIPSRFEIGFPVPTDRPEGEINGYHCWVNFYLPETGWFPIDASEARKHPAQKDLLFGTQLPDRIQFTTGRDIELGPGHLSGPLNYFVYPHLEQHGKLYSGYTREFRYKNI